MIVDRRKDTYDELQILAGDVRTRRRRANMVTTALIVIGIVGTIAYIAAMSDQVEGLQGQRDVAQAQRRDAIDLLAAAQAELQDLKLQMAQAQIAIYKDNADRFAEVAAGKAVTIAFPDGIDTSQPQPAMPQLSFANFVWVVDGSRRFPMTNRDVLWIPEAQFWVRLQDPLDPGLPPTTVSRHTGSRPAATTGDERLVLRDTDPVEYPINAGNNNPGVARCVSLALSNTTSDRPGFGIQYYDMNVTLLPKPDCGVRSPYRFEMTAGDVVQVPDLPIWISTEPRTAPSTGSARPTGVRIHRGITRPLDDAAGEAYPGGGLPLTLAADDPRRAYANRLCVRLEDEVARSEQDGLEHSRPRERRPLSHADVIVMLTDAAACPATF